ncbi:hypothetical protein [Streptosporangium sp. NPDC002721]|uniref:hypothetical protein n=1 Tax=Streptosporangium sp. NPDC002721 TaxID=3366188 RepID=UPI003690CD0B
MIEVDGQSMRLATGRWKDFDPETGVPIRITVGHPRFIRYPYERAMSLAPHELFAPPYKDINDIPTERWVYTKRLVAHQADILRELTAIAAKHPGKTGVLLCYENVNAGETCHRRWAAEWFRDNYGWDVPEIQSRPDSTKPREPSGPAQLLAF